MLLGLLYIKISVSLLSLILYLSLQPTSHSGKNTQTNTWTHTSTCTHNQADSPICETTSWYSTGNGSPNTAPRSLSIGSALFISPPNLPLLRMRSPSRVKIVGQCVNFTICRLRFGCHQFWGTLRDSEMICWFEFKKNYKFTTRANYWDDTDLLPIGTRIF